MQNVGRTFFTNFHEPKKGYVPLQRLPHFVFSHSWKSLNILIEFAFYISLALTANRKHFSGGREKGEGCKGQNVHELQHEYHVSNVFRITDFLFDIISPVKMVIFKCGRGRGKVFGITRWRCMKLNSMVMCIPSTRSSQWDRQNKEKTVFSSINSVLMRGEKHGHIQASLCGILGTGM